MMGREAPWLAKPHEVRAILDGRQSQFRRKVKHDIPPHLTHVRRLTNTNGDEGAVITEHPDMRAGQLAASVWCPYGKPGDRIWVRETHLIRGAGTVVDYRADMDPIDAAGHGAFYGGWKPSLFMRREHSRITLEVVNVRVERLENLSESDAMAEGCPFPNMADGPDPRKWYADLWQHISGPGSWEANPWVWVVGFKVMRPLRTEVSNRSPASP